MGADAYPEFQHLGVVDLAPLPSLKLPFGRRMQPLAVQLPKIAALLRPTGRDGLPGCGKKKYDELQRLKRQA